MKNEYTLTLITASTYLNVESLESAFNCGWLTKTRRGIYVNIYACQFSTLTFLFVGKLEV